MKNTACLELLDEPVADSPANDLESLIHSQLCLLGDLIIISTRGRPLGQGADAKGPHLVHQKEGI